MGNPVKNLINEWFTLISEDANVKEHCNSFGKEEFNFLNDLFSYQKPIPYVHIDWDSDSRPDEYGSQRKFIINIVINIVFDADYVNSQKYHSLYNAVREVINANQTMTFDDDSANNFGNWTSNKKDYNENRVRIITFSLPYTYTQRKQ